MSKLKLKELVKFSNKYIAISVNNEIIASDSSVMKLEEKLKNRENEEIRIQYIPPVDKFISPLCL